MHSDRSSAGLGPHLGFLARPPSAAIGLQICDSAGLHCCPYVVDIIHECHIFHNLGLGLLALERFFGKDTSRTAECHSQSLPPSTRWV